MIVLEKKLTIHSKYYKKILLLLNIFHNSSRLVGGCVRDALLDRFNSDIDIATTLLPEEVLKILIKNKIKVVPTGIKFGTISAFYKGEKFEITTLRKDLDCTGRHAKVSFTSDFAADAARRDFTINALSYCPFENKIYDYFNGLEDLKFSRIVFIGNPKERIKEDFLRILRFFRFSCYYAKKIDNEGLLACAELKTNLKSLSKERIKWEIDKLLASNNAPHILLIMFKIRILEIIFSITNFNFQYLTLTINFAHTLNIQLPIYTRYAILFSSVESLKIHDLIHLKFSKKESIKIVSLINFLNDFEKFPSDYLLKKIWLEEEHYLEYICVAVGKKKITKPQAKSFIEHYKKIKKSSFPLSGLDLLELGIRGIKVGVVLNLLKKLWIEKDFKLNKHELLAAYEEF